jgi:DNA-binding transcriptional regulator GbsR (MarR family)
MNAMINPILSKAIAVYGVENQTIKAIEEMSELIKELSKVLLGKEDNDHIREEIADVEIMIEQLKDMYDTHDGKNIEAFRNEKITRLGKRLDEDEAI